MKKRRTRRKTKGWWDIEYRADTRGKQIVWLREIGKIIYDSIGQPLRSFGIIQDITDLRKVDQVKSEFVSTVSHELRTPLTSIKASLGLVLGVASDDLTEQTKFLIEIAHRNCDQLEMLINDLLDIEKFETGDIKISMAPVRLADLINEAVEAYQVYGEPRGITFVVKGDIPNVSINGDKGRLLQVMANLMSNAIKFSPDQGKVELSATTADGMAHITVRDQGPGIPVEFREQIFDKFTQADSSDARHTSGSGLGLSIAKRIIERHGGTIYFETEEGKGTDFIVCLPCSS